MLLFGLVVVATKEYPPKIHNLSQLAELAGISLPEKARRLLAQVNEFNLEVRYPDERLKFYQLITRSYADRYYRPIRVLYKMLCQKLKQKK